MWLFRVKTHVRTFVIIFSSQKEQMQQLVRIHTENSIEIMLYE